MSNLNFSVQSDDKNLPELRTVRLPQFFRNFADMLESHTVSLEGLDAVLSKMNDLALKVGYDLIDNKLLPKL